MNRTNTLTTRQLALCGMLAALAMIFGYIESLVPLPIPVPGIKLGLANIVVLFALYAIGLKAAVMIGAAKVVLCTLLFGNPLMALFSLAGTTVAIVLGWFFKRVGSFGIVGVSCVCAVGHNIGQLAVATFVMGTASVWSLLPPLTLAGIVTGAATGSLAALALKALEGHGDAAKSSGKLPAKPAASSLLQPKEHSSRTPR